MGCSEDLKNTLRFIWFTYTIHTEFFNMSALNKLISYMLMTKGVLILRDNTWLTHTSAVCRICICIKSFYIIIYITATNSWAHMSHAVSVTPVYSPAPSLFSLLHYWACSVTLWLNRQGCDSAGHCHQVKMCTPYILVSALFFLFSNYE